MQGRLQSSGYVGAEWYHYLFHQLFPEHSFLFGTAVTYEHIEIDSHTNVDMSESMWKYT